MALRLLHQVGHNSKWNVESFENDACGDGLILSPLHQAMGTVEKLSFKTKAVSIFDPQFYLPNSRKAKLLSYPFFPEQVDGGFQTSTFVAHVSDVAKSCMDFQVAQGFRKVVVPTRYINQMYPSYFTQQNQFTVDAFMEHAGNRPLCLSVALTAPMIQDPEWREQVLNWITSFPQVDEVYIMYEHDRSTKQVGDAKFLKDCITFCSDIMNTGLAVTLGYTNTEGLLYTVAGEITITMGAFENTRIFSVDKFLESEGERRGPKARIYLPGLFNWVQFEDAKRIRNGAPDVWDKVYAPTEWAETALQSEIEPTFNQSPLYKHYFKNMQQHMDEIRHLNAGERREILLSKINSAMSAYRQLHHRGIELEKHGQAGHLGAWQQALM